MASRCKGPAHCGFLRFIRTLRLIAAHLIRLSHRQSCQEVLPRLLLGGVRQRLLRRATALVTCATRADVCGGGTAHFISTREATVMLRASMDGICICTGCVDILARCARSGVRHCKLLRPQLFVAILIPGPACATGGRRRRRRGARER